MSAERKCLQCGETSSSIKAQGIVLCGVVEGYYEPELVEEWPRHRWVDWRDSDLARFGVKPDAYDRHRRTPALTFQWIACDDTQRGHIPARADDVPDFASHVGQCICCGRPATDRENGSER